MMKVANRGCIRRLSRKSMAAARTRNIVAVLAIALTSILFTSLFTIAAALNASTEQYNFRTAGGDIHASVKNLTWEQVEQLRGDPELVHAGARLFLGSPEYPPFHKSHVEVSYVEPEIGARFTLDFYIDTETSHPTAVRRTFTLSGWWEHDPVNPASQVLVSRSAAEEIAALSSGDPVSSTGKWTMGVMFQSSSRIADDLNALLDALNRLEWGGK